MTAAEHRTLFGLSFDNVDLRQALGRIDEYIRSGRPHMVFSANVFCLFLWRHHPVIQWAYRETDLLTVDGMALFYASRLLGTPIRESVSGSALFFELLALADARGYRVFLLGAEPAVVAEAGQRLTRSYPSLQLVGVHDGYFQPGDEPEVVTQIRAAAPDVLLLGMSSPLKERFAWAYRDHLQVPVIIGVGGMLDIAAGRCRRAPVIVRTACLEWLWRLVQEPRRLCRRYAVTNTLFLGLLLRELLRTYMFRRRDRPGLGHERRRGDDESR